MEASKNPLASPDVSLHLHTLAFIPADPPPPPTIRYYYSTVAAKNVCYIYRVVEDRGRFSCHPEAKGWPQLSIASAHELQTSFTLLEDDHILSSMPDPATPQPGRAWFPDLEELRMDWQVESTVYFRHCDVRTPGKVVGRFVWKMPAGAESGSDVAAAKKDLRLVLLLQLPTNELLLSSQVTDLERPEQLGDKEEVYIQGISLISVVATLIANVAYLTSVDPIRGTESDPSRHGVAIASRLTLPSIFMFFNAFAFYASVLAVVLMTAFIPVYGTAGEWGAIFLSGSVPVVMGLVAFYVAYTVSAWAVLASWEKPLGITLVGILMVVYVRFWAIELMHGNVDRNLQITARYSPWEWWNHRLEEDIRNREDGIAPSTSARRMSRTVRSTASMVRRFFFSPTIWQLSLLGTVPGNYKTHKKTKLLFQHFAQTATPLQKYPKKS